LDLVQVEGVVALFLAEVLLVLVLAVVVVIFVVLLNLEEVLVEDVGLEVLFVLLLLLLLEVVVTVVDPAAAHLPLVQLRERHCSSVLHALAVLSRHFLSTPSQSALLLRQSRSTRHVPSVFSARQEYVGPHSPPYSHGWRSQKPE